MVRVSCCPALYAYDNSTITFCGRNFAAAGGNLQIVGQNVLGTGTLSGEWFDGTSWSVKIAEHYSTASIQVIPEPMSLLVLSAGVAGIAGQVIRRKR